MDFWLLSTTYHNTQAVLTIRRAVASAFVGYCFRDSSPATRKVDCITVHYTLIPVLLSLFFRLLFACYYYSRATHRLHRGLCGDVPATKFTLFVGARFTQGSRFFTLPHGCIIALLGNSFTWLHYLATYCTISRGAALCATFIHMAFTNCTLRTTQLVCLTSYPQQHFIWLFTSIYLSRCSRESYIFHSFTFPIQKACKVCSIGNSRPPVSITRKMVSPSPILLESRLGSQFIMSKSAMSHAFSGPRFPPVVALRSVSHGCKGALLQPWRAQGRSSVRRLRRLAQLVGYPTPPAGRLALGVMLPTFAPVGGLGGLMLQTSRRRRARLARRPCRWPWPRPWRTWWPLSRPRLAPCAQPCALQPWRGPRP